MILQKLWLLCQLRNSASFMVPESSIPCLKELVTEFILNQIYLYHTLIYCFFKMQFTLNRKSKLRNPQLIHSFYFRPKFRAQLLSSIPCVPHTKPIPLFSISRILSLIYILIHKVRPLNNETPHSSWDSHVISKGNMQYLQPEIIQSRSNPRSFILK